MTSAQMRAGRALVNWTVRELSERSAVHRNTISNIETGKSGGDRATIAAIQRVLENAGVIFVEENGEGPGVRLRKGKR